MHFFRIKLNILQPFTKRERKNFRIKNNKQPIFKIPFVPGRNSLNLKEVEAITNTIKTLQPSIITFQSKGEP